MSRATTASFVDSFTLNLTRLLASSTIAIAGILFGLAPQLDQAAWKIEFNASALAQEFSEEQIENYAQAILTMESHRQQAYQDIMQIIGSSPPNIVCNQPGSYSDLPDDAQAIATKYCDISKQIVENSGLSVAQFNSITSQAQSDSNLEKRIQNAMVEIQQ